MEQNVSTEMCTIPGVSEVAIMLNSMSVRKGSHLLLK